MLVVPGASSGLTRATAGNPEGRGSGALRARSLAADTAPVVSGLAWAAVGNPEGCGNGARRDQGLTVAMANAAVAGVDSPVV
eukprot:10315431-Lingulodinium_polyedra.AAC.1